jgi:hypothetical protein
MVQVHDSIIDHPSAWRSADIGGKEGLLVRLTRDHFEALDELLARTRSIPDVEISRDDFAHPLLETLMQGVRREIMDGRGAVVLSQLDLGRYSYEDYRRIYWGLGTYLGNGTVQSYRRDKIGLVQKEEDNPTARGYLMDTELRSHTDFHELLSLACVRKAEEGGLSGVVSSLAIHNAIYESRPELLEPLYEGYYHESAGGQVSETKVPIYGEVEGLVSCYYHMPFMLNAAKILGTELPAELLTAMRYMNEQALRPDIRADFMLEPGEMLFWHNFTALHSRTAFKDTPANKRLLMRLWLNVPNGRPLPEQFLDRARYMDEVHQAGEAAIDYAKKVA